MRTIVRLITASLMLAGPAQAATNAPPLTVGTTAGTARDAAAAIAAESGAKIAASAAAKASVVRLVSNGSNDISTDNIPTTIKWTSLTAVTKTETLPACNASASNFNPLIVMDGAGTAATYPITVKTASGTIGGAPFIIIRNSGASYTFVCDGVSDWSVN